MGANSHTVPAPRRPRAEEGGAARPLIVAVGDNVVDCYPQLGVMYPGGNAVNVAVNARRVGAESAYIGAVGTDAAGDLVRRSLQAEGVDVSRVRVLPGPNAAATVQLVEGNREFVGGDAGVSRFTVDAGDLDLLAGASIVHTGECSMLEGDLHRIADRARVLSFDFSERDLDYVREHAPVVDVAILSQPASATQEAVQLAMTVAEWGPRVVAITMGSRGALVLHDGVVSPAAAGHADVIDTLGAGDAFIARLLVGMAREEPFPALVANATSYASSTCSSQGAFGYETPLHIDPPQARESARQA